MSFEGFMKYPSDIGGPQNISIFLLEYLVICNFFFNPIGVICDYFSDTFLFLCSLIYLGHESPGGFA